MVNAFVFMRDKCPECTTSISARSFSARKVRFRERANTVSTAAGGCQDNWGQRGGCVVGAGKALGADMLKGAAVNGMLRLLGAGRWISPVGVGMAVMEPTGVADGTIEGYCRTTRIKSDPICGSFGYTYR